MVPSGRLVGRLIVPPTNIPGLFAGEHPALLNELRARLKAADIDPDKSGKDNDTRADQPGKDGSRETTSNGGCRPGSKANW